MKSIAWETLSGEGEDDTMPLTALQSVAMLVKIISLCALLTELVIMIWEVKLWRDAAKLGMKDGKKLTEEERRRAWGKKLSWVALGSMAAFIVVLIVGVASTSARTCPAGEAMESATCVPCADPNCGNCSDGPNRCLGSCPEGWFLDSAAGKCARCDGEAADSDQTLRCLECEAGVDGG